ncbi:MAG: toprim domain-containing protein [Pirellulales bacterium]
MTRISRERYGGPVKLVDCVAHGPGSGAELFVVEGDSAAASVCRVSDRRWQAVLPMQGKPLNAVKASRGKVAGHPLFSALTAAIGTGIEPQFDAAGLRYERILVLMDPDADGIHCGVLLLMFFHRWMPQLLDAGRVEVVRPPWGEVAVAGEPTVRHAFSDRQLAALAAEMQVCGNVVTRRYRGLAAIDATILRDTCLVSATRKIDRVTSAEVEAMIEMLGSLEPG